MDSNLNKIELDANVNNIEHGHSHESLFKLTRVKALLIMMTLNVTFFFVELVIGNLSNSNSLVADSFHMLSDLISFIVALVAIQISHKTNPNRNTYGWVRAEVLGSLINAVFLLALCFSITVEALNRFFEPEYLEHIDLILIVGAIGLLINIFGLFVFGQLGGHHLHSHAKKLKKKSNFVQSDESGAMNIRGVFLHVLADALGSVAILISTLLVKYVPYNGGFNWKLYIDPCLSLLIAFLITFTTIPLLKESSLVLLQTVPREVDIDKIRNELKHVDSVLDVHHLHVWTLNTDCYIGSVHVRVADDADKSIFNHLQGVLHKHKIHSLTLQIEYEHTKNEYDNCESKDCCKFQCCNNGLKQRKSTVHPI